jgi:hypothetical protein
LSAVIAAATAKRKLEMPKPCPAEKRRNGGMELITLASLSTCRVRKTASMFDVVHEVGAPDNARDDETHGRADLGKSQTLATSEVDDIWWRPRAGLK